MFLITIQKIVFIVRIISNKMELCEKLKNWMVSVEIKAWKKIEKEEEEAVRHLSLTSMKQLLSDRKQLKKPKKLKKIGIVQLKIKHSQNTNPYNAQSDHHQE